MITLIVVLSFCLLATMAFIFWRLQVSKNTLSTIESIMNTIANKISNKSEIAYDNKYYPATVIAIVKFDMSEEKIITDFSHYNEEKIINFIINTKDSIEKYYENIFYQLDDEELNLLKQPFIFGNVIVYAFQKNKWTWKSNLKYEEGNSNDFKRH